MLDGIGGLSATQVNMLTPWLEVAETYIEEGEVTTEDWVGAVGATIGAAVSGGGGPDTTAFESAISNLGKNLLIGGAMAAFDEDVGLSYLENAVGQEIGSLIGGGLANVTGLRKWAETAYEEFSDNARAEVIRKNAAKAGVVAPELSAPDASRGVQTGPRIVNGFLVDAQGRALDPRTGKPILLASLDPMMAMQLVSDLSSPASLVGELGGSETLLALAADAAGTGGTDASCAYLGS